MSPRDSHAHHLHARRCPYCGFDDAVSNYISKEGRSLYRCPECHHLFTDLSDAIAALKNPPPQKAELRRGRPVNQRRD